MAIIYKQTFEVGDLPTGWSLESGSVGNIATGTVQTLMGFSAGSNFAGASGGGALYTDNVGVPETVIILFQGVISTIGYKDIRVGWGAARQVNSPTPTFQWSYNGSAWYSVAFTNVPADLAWANTINVALPAETINVSNLRFRWIWVYGTYVGDEASLMDDFTVYGEPSFQIKDTPQQYEPVHNDLPFVVSGTNNTQTNFRYWCDIYFHGSTSYDYRLSTFPRPDGFGFFNLKTIIRDYVTGDLDIDSTEGFNQCTNMFKPYSVCFGDSYGASGTVTSGLASSGVYYAYDGSLEWDEFITYSQNTRAINSTTTVAKFLTNQYQHIDSNFDFTNRNLNTLVADNENAWIYMAVKTTAVAYKMAVVTYDSSLSIIGSYTIDNPYQGLNSNNDRFLRFPSGTYNLNTIPSASVSGSTPPIITSSVKYYTLTMTNSGGVATSYVMAYEVLSNCSKYDSYRLHYKNKWGGFDSFTFNAVNRQSGEIERKSYKKQYGTISSAGNWAYTKKERGITNYSTKSKRKLLLKSDWVTEAKYELLIELIESPQVYWDDSNELYAVNILSSSYDVKTLKNDKLFNLELEVEFTQMNRRQ